MSTAKSTPGLQNGPLLGDTYSVGLTLRRRLTLLVALTIVVPITAVGVTVVNLIVNEGRQRTNDRMVNAAAFAQAELTRDRTDVVRLARVAGEDPSLAAAAVAGGASLDAALRRAVVDLDLDALIVADRGASGAATVLAAARRDPVFADGFAPPTDAELLARASGSDPPPGAVVGQAVLADAVTVTAVRWIDGDRLSRLARPEGVGLTIVVDGAIAATTTDIVALPSGTPLDGAFDADFGKGGRPALAIADPDLGVTILATSPPFSGNGRVRLFSLFAALLALLLVLIVLVGNVVSGLVTGPVEDLAEAARAVSRGDLTQRVDPGGDAELAALGRAFNEMTDNLRDHVEELERSRHEFQAAMARLGDVLVSTHDIGGIIDVVLEACVLTLRVREALFFERVAMPARIRATAAHSWAVPNLELNGNGVAGAAARRLASVTYPGDVELAEGEPDDAAAMAVPVVSDGRLFGVIAVYGRERGSAFRPEDVHTLQTLARQTEVAIGNVFLHDETRRQARTDGTTGLWNRREFELRCHESVKEAVRFKEPFAVVLADIDDFKQVNDRFDHSTGDAALIWLASRLSEATREIDVVARWGGEEFIILLPRAGQDEAMAVAERIRATVAATPMTDGGRSIPLTVSIGVAIHPADGSTANALFKSADAALLRAKRLGKNRVEAADRAEGAA